MSEQLHWSHSTQELFASLMEKVYLKQLQLCHPYQCTSKIHNAGFRMQAFVTFEPLITSPSGGTRNSWRLSMCILLSDRLAQPHRFNLPFPLCLVCVSLRFRRRTELTSLEKNHCCGVGWYNDNERTITLLNNKREPCSRYGKTRSTGTITGDEVLRSVALIALCH